VLLDVTPLTLGVETLGGVMTKLITRNTTIPTSRKEVFSTAADGQTEVTIHVLQGEREMARDNRSLERFNLTGIPPAPRGVPQIEVTFDIDANGILTVTAKDKATGKESRIEIKGSSGLSKDEVERMKREAEQHADEDRRLREVIEARNQADNLIYQTEKTLKEHGDKVPSDERAKVESAVNLVKEAMKGDDAEAIRKSLEGLMTASQAVGKIMYEKVAREQAGTSAGAAGEAVGASGKRDAGNEDVIDAEFEVKDDK
jgi:molecular chaperone DnaK